MPTKEEKIEEYIKEFTKKFKGDVQIESKSDCEAIKQMKEWLRSTLTSHAAFIEGNLRRQVEGKKKKAQKYPMKNTPDTIDKRYNDGYEGALDDVLLLLANPKTDETK